ncbi:hypothetical protein CcrC1_gp317 [Caulobacter phage C1]|nr:hypothetical protein CcrC1_gp317 [Caulobacter phage C1]UTU08546.1 hypothetical protein CcrC2_gp318 [Caulobacter phage C2]UTU09062.1 hypothetical protein CcrJ4_gp313 [Caulobacter phage J4]UTU09621.1 hypothetical protein CcrBL47_gp335 [Caulobacter phage BL47]UTU10179.1 hypothetical protein CcrRB23_gp317 [Caulobacter phage RB23]WGN97213.1 hypothetical protein [Bertelyvirus sp.]
MTNLALKATDSFVRDGAYYLYDCNLNRRLTDEDFAHAGVTLEEVCIALSESYLSFHAFGEPGAWDLRDRLRCGTLDFPVRGATVLLTEVRKFIDDKYKPRKEAEAKAQAEAEAFDAAMEDIRILLTQGLDNDGVSISRAQCAKILRGLRVPAF